MFGGTEKPAEPEQEQVDPREKIAKLLERKRELSMDRVPPDNNVEEEIEKDLNAIKEELGEEEYERIVSEIQAEKEGNEPEMPAAA